MQFTDINSRRPNIILSILQCKCPVCRRGKMFIQPSPFRLKSTLKMNEQCEVCHISFYPERGFYFGTGYVSYALSIALSVASFLFTLVIIGLSIKDNSLFYWLGANTLLLLTAQPVIMRISRAIWLAFFTKRTNKE